MSHDASPLLPDSFFASLGESTRKNLLTIGNCLLGLDVWSRRSIFPSEQQQRSSRQENSMGLYHFTRTDSLHALVDC